MQTPGYSTEKKQKLFVMPPIKPPEPIKNPQEAASHQSPQETHGAHKVPGKPILKKVAAKVKRHRRRPNKHC